ncbi:glycosyltransferase [Vibrio vulnificus]|uniref:glycosyltransferase n=1 Tax=Vibrio vulnificus TaxID=672 RepID=UPI001EEAA345|nr:glycosyltransferase [Vibrio vulnificus]MCG6305670.1 glycosyltransferase [Vibrio vulnificus]
MENSKVVYLILNGSPYGGSEKHVVDIFNKVNREKKLVYSHGNSLIDNIDNASGAISIGRGFFGFLKVLRIVKIEKPDILHAHAARGVFFARIVKLLLSKTGFCSFKLISTSHGLWVPPSKKKLRIGSLLHLFKEQDDITLAVSKFSRKELLDLGYAENKLKYIYNGIDFSTFDSVRTIKENVKNVAFIGRLTEQKGIYYLMELIKRERKSNVSFEIFGAGHLDDYVGKFIAQNKLKNVSFRGHTNNIKEVFSYTDLLIAPSLDEGLPYTLVEAINCGLPIISTKVGGIPEIVEDGVNGYLVDPGNIEQLCEAFSRIKTADLRSMSLESIKISKKFSLDKMVEAIESEYNKCLIK